MLALPLLAIIVNNRINWYKNNIKQKNQKPFEFVFIENLQMKRKFDWVCLRLKHKRAHNCNIIQNKKKKTHWSEELKQNWWS